MSNQGQKSLLVALLVAVFIWACILSASCQSHYQFKGPKIGGIVLMAIAAAADGAVEGYDFDNRTSFERKFNWGPYSFGGSLSWTNVYNNHQVDQGFKSALHKWYGAFDFYHVADDVRAVGYKAGGGMFFIGSYKQNTRRRHWLLDVVIVSVVTSGAKSLGMKWIRS